MIIETNQAYHANEAVSHSKLEVFRRRPMLYYKRYVAKILAREPASAAFRVGSAAHAVILEPLTWHEQFAVRPEGIDRRTKQGKEEFAAFEAQHAGKTIIDQDEAAQIAEMAASVASHPLANQLLAHGFAERSFRSFGKSFAIQCRPDWINLGGCELSGGRPYIADVKTTESLADFDFGSFERTVFRYGYHRQAGFYLPLVSESVAQPVYDFFFIAVEKVEPYGVAVYRMTDEACALGQDETVADLTRLEACIESNQWPNIEPTLRELGVPSWYTKGARND